MSKEDLKKGLKELIAAAMLAVGPTSAKAPAVHQDQLEGGRADTKSPSDFHPDQIQQGTNVEMEHTDKPEAAREIAMDHLTEDPKYYTKLKSIEPEPHGIRFEPETLHPELHPIAHLESSFGKNMNHKPSSKGEHDTALGALGLKPITAYDEYLRSKHLQALFPKLDKIEDLITEMKANPAFYNSVAATHWNRLKKSMKTPERAAFAWRWGLGAGKAAKDDVIANDPYVKKYMKISGESQKPEVQKSEDLDKAIADIPVGQYSGLDTKSKFPGLGFQLTSKVPFVYNYDHLLSPQHIADGYSLKVRTNRQGPDARGVYVSLHRWGHPYTFGFIDAHKHDSWTWRPEGMEGLPYANPKHLMIYESALHPDHRGKGLGTAMYEALYAHGKNALGAGHIIGGKHSTMAHRVHKKLAEKHGLNYQTRENEDSAHDRTQLRPEAPWTPSDPHEYDAAYSTYRYDLKSEEELGKARPEFGFPQLVDPRSRREADIASTPRQADIKLQSELQGWRRKVARDAPYTGDTLSPYKQDLTGMRQIIRTAHGFSPVNSPAAVSFGPELRVAQRLRAGQETLPIDYEPSAINSTLLHENMHQMFNKIEQKYGAGARTHLARNILRYLHETNPHASKALKAWVDTKYLGRTELQSKPEEEHITGLLNYLNSEPIRDMYATKHGFPKSNDPKSLYQTHHSAMKDAYRTLTEAAKMANEKWLRPVNNIQELGLTPEHLTGRSAASQFKPYAGIKWPTVVAPRSPPPMPLKRSEEELEKAKPSLEFRSMGLKDPKSRRAVDYVTTPKQQELRALLEADKVQGILRRQGQPLNPKELHEFRGINIDAVKNSLASASMIGPMAFVNSGDLNVARAKEQGHRAYPELYDPKSLQAAAQHEDMHQMFTKITHSYGGDARANLAKNLVNHLAAVNPIAYDLLRNLTSGAYNTNSPHFNEEMVTNLITYVNSPPLRESFSKRQGLTPSKHPTSPHQMIHTALKDAYMHMAHFVRHADERWLEDPKNVHKPLLTVDQLRGHVDAVKDRHYNQSDALYNQIKKERYGGKGF